MAKSSHRIRIHAPAERVYQALTSTDGLQGWFTPHVAGNEQEGGEMTMSFSGKESFHWKVSALKPLSHVHWECLKGPGAAAGTSVTYKLSAAGHGQTVIECDHDGWPAEHDAMATCNTLWGLLMGRLKEFSETGKPHPAFT